MVNGDMVQGLTFYEKGRHHVIKLFQFCFRKREARTGFASDLFVFFLCIRSPVKTFFQGTFGPLPTAIADVGRLGKVRVDIFFIRDTGKGTLAAGPAKLVIGEVTGMAEFLDRTLMEESGTAVIEGSA